MNVKEKFFGSMTHKQYKTLENISNVSALAGLPNIFLSMPPTFELVLGSYALLSAIYYFKSIKNNYEKYTKDMVNLINLYNSLIEDYTKLIHTLELTHPTEIYQMYNKMLYNGHLSYNGEYKFGDSPNEDISYLMGANVITGKAVCRHTASMLRDIYECYGMSSQTLPVNCFIGEELMKGIKESIKLMKKEILNSNDEKFIELMTKSLFMLEEIYASYKKELRMVDKGLANHVITLVGHDNTCYMFDPTNQTIFHKDSTFLIDSPLTSPIVSSKTEFTKICDKKSTFLPKEKRKVTTQNLLLPDSCEEENQAIITTTNNLLDRNQDIIHGFADQHRELYEEINNSLLKVRKRMKIKIK